ncbi:MAG: CvpA family protein [Anaerolineae bacterium]|nr:CvpA family protein [Anaerolineae bacterium]
MNPIDLLFVLLGLMIVVFAVLQRFIRTILMLVGAYIAALSSGLLYRPAAFRLEAIGQGSAWFEGIMFMLLFLIVFMVFFIITKVGYPDTSLPKLGFFDQVLGGILGIVVALIVLAVLYNGLGVMVERQWMPYATYANISAVRSSAALGPVFRTVMQFLGYAYFPFFFSVGFPPALVPR